jgi:hypothetical protein
MGAIGMRQQPDVLAGTIGVQQFAKADGVQTGDVARFVMVGGLVGTCADNITDITVAAGTIAGRQHGVRSGHRATRQRQRQDDGLARAGRHAEAAAIAQATIEFECGVIQPPGFFRADLDASPA